eukprot:14781332-Alexandrium_andersonii.AAC.1
MCIRDILCPSGGVARSSRTYGRSPGRGGPGPRIRAEARRESPPHVAQDAPALPPRARAAQARG